MTEELDIDEMLKVCEVATVGCNDSTFESHMRVVIYNKTFDPPTVKRLLLRLKELEDMHKENCIYLACSESGGHTWDNDLCTMCGRVICKSLPSSEVNNE